MSITPMSQSKQNYAADPSHSLSQNCFLGIRQDLRYKTEKHWQEDLITFGLGSGFFGMGHWKG